MSDFRAFGRLRRLPVFPLLLTVAAGALSAQTYAADDFFGIPTASSSTPIMSADGTAIIFNLTGFNPTASIWTASGLSPLAGVISVAAVSGNGSVFAGRLSSAPLGRSSVWTATTSNLLSLLPSTSGGVSVNAISADGKVVIGESPTMMQHQAVRWTADTDPQLPWVATDLSVGTNALASNAKYVSDDGKVVAGWLSLGNSVYHIFRWENGATLDIMPSWGGSNQEALLSGNGLVIAGLNADPTYGNWRWVGGANGTMLDHVVYLPGATTTRAHAISYDGSITVGYGTLPGTIAHAFRWINGVGTDLGALDRPAYSYSSAEAMSADGKIVVGFSLDAANEYHAVRWNESGQLRKLSDLLTDGGVDITGWGLSNATDISNDGTVILGSGTTPSNTSGYWVAHCVASCKDPDPVLAIITPETAAQSFSGLGGLGGTASTYLGTQIGSLGDMSGSDGGVTGFAYGAFDGDPTTSATVGATYSFGDDLTIAGSLGIADIQTLLPFNGSAMFTGPSAALALSSKPDSGLNWLVGGSLIGLSGTVDRGYLNGNTPVISSGSTSGTGAGFTAEAGWTFNDLIADTLVTPFVGVTVSSLTYAGYTETSGPFPSTFSSFTTNSAVLRFGVEAKRAFAPCSWITTGLSYGHNFGNGGTIAGTVVGMPLSVPGAGPVADYIEASVGLDMPITEQIDFSGRIAAIFPIGGAASVQARAGIRMSF